MTSYLRSKYDCCIKTLFLNKPVINADYLDIVDTDCDVVGIFVDISYFEKALEVFKYVKLCNKNAITFSFGRVSSICTKELLKRCQYINYAILGDPEEPVRKIIESAACGRKAVDASIATHNDFENKELAKFSGDINRWPCFDYYELDSMEKNKYKIHCISTKAIYSPRRYFFVTFSPFSASLFSASRLENLHPQ